MPGKNVIGNCNQIQKWLDEISSITVAFTIDYDNSVVGCTRVGSYSHSQTWTRETGLTPFDTEPELPDATFAYYRECCTKQGCWANFIWSNTPVYPDGEKFEIEVNCPPTVRTDEYDIIYSFFISLSEECRISFTLNVGTSFTGLMGYFGGGQEFTLEELLGIHEFTETFTYGEITATVTIS